jgi:hypothetical protein
MSELVSRASNGFLKTLAYLYKTLCQTLLVLGLLKFLFDDGSWINYLILSAIGGCLWLAGQHGIRRIFSAASRNPR